MNSTQKQTYPPPQKKKKKKKKNSKVLLGQAESDLVIN